jgi:hypothetical protein
MDIACELTPISWASPPLGAAFVGGLLCLAMTPNDFRVLELSQLEAVEGFRKGRPDFRVWRKSFARGPGRATHRRSRCFLSFGLFGPTRAR